MWFVIQRSMCLVELLLVLVNV